jgi:glucose-6-phosphate 1-dehydrogenase
MPVRYLASRFYVKIKQNMIQPKNHILVIFGASGDLTYRKLVPAVFDLFDQDLLPEKFAILGLGRTDLGNTAFREKMKDGIKQFALNKPNSEEKLNQYLEKLHYFSFDTKDPDEYCLLKGKLRELDEEYGTNNNFIYYMATPPNMYEIIPDQLS